MLFFRSLRTGTGLIALASLMFLIALSLGGCSDDETSTTAADVPAPPTLPAPEQFAFDFSFFDSGSQPGKAAGDSDNFVNAYLRTIILDAMAHLVLAGPVGAFSAAVHTVPVAQDDGSWVWTYTWQHGPDPLYIILRGIPAVSVVEWELSLATVNQPDPVLWFSGTTNGNGDHGHWLFHDLDSNDHPVNGEIAWGNDTDGHYLEFVSHELDNMDNTLRFTEDYPNFLIEYTPGNGGDQSFVQWHASGTGSLRVPDYNGGLEACWDEIQQDVDCQ